MGIFKKIEKPKTKDKDIYTRIEYNLNNNDNIQGERHVISDVRFPIGENIYKIDLVMISEKGIFIINPAKIEGQIIGSENETMWRNTSNKSCRNPLEENKEDKRALSNFLRINIDKIYTYVVISSNSVINIPYSKKEYIIAKECDLYYFLGIHMNILPDTFSIEQINKMKSRLNKMNIIKQLTE